MKTTSPHASLLRKALEQPSGGVVGLVDDLLRVCAEHGLQLDWNVERCRVRPIDGEWEELMETPFRKSVFRAILARLAALCNERTPNSVSPYGGQGELSAGEHPSAVFKIKFVNTPAEQQLELTFGDER